MFQDYNTSINSSLTSKGEKTENNKFQKENRVKIFVGNILIHVYKKLLALNLPTSSCIREIRPWANHSDILWPPLPGYKVLKHRSFPTSHSFCYRFCNCLICWLTITTSLHGFDPLQSYTWAAGRKAASFSLAQHVHSMSRKPGKWERFLLPWGQLRGSQWEESDTQHSGDKRSQSAFLKARHSKQLINI